MTTLLDELVRSIDRTRQVPDGSAEPSVILWTDPESQWRPVLDSLRAAFPNLLTLGDYDPDTRTGPAIWLRCVIDGALPEVLPGDSAPPILYLPGIGISTLRSVEDCPAPIRPLVELQFRGRVWRQRNNRDWTVEAFLTSEDALGLDVAMDAATREALARSLDSLASISVDSLRGRRLDADDFDKLAVSDPTVELLRWMSDPTAFERTHEGAHWTSFASLCKSQFRFDPDAEGVSGAAEHLLNQDATWDGVWDRFCENPIFFTGIPSLLAAGTAKQPLLALEPARNPKANDVAEDQLRTALGELGGLAHGVACDRVLALEAEHGGRRSLVWTRLGRSTMAVVLEHLAQLASLSRLPVGGPTFRSIAEAYADAGWKGDAAALEALTVKVAPADVSLVEGAVKALYGPWLDASARQFQKRVGETPADYREAAAGLVAEPGTCLIFIDGLRLDLGRRLVAKLEATEHRCSFALRFSPIPTVTATAKALASPLSGGVNGNAACTEFMPTLSINGKPLIAAQFREELDRLGVTVLDRDDLAGPEGDASVGWLEVGQIDERGHELNIELVKHLDDELEKIVYAVSQVFDAGWKRVRLVTDHGWLLLPGGLPKVDLPAYLVATKWSRCAIPSGSGSGDADIYTWHWHLNTRIASPPGIACFRSGKAYAHGGVSVQECVTPDITVERGASVSAVSISDVRWKGLVCRVKVAGGAGPFSADLRRNWKDATSSVVAAVKSLDQKGEASLFVEDDLLEGEGANVVILDASGSVVARLATTIGEHQ